MGYDLHVHTTASDGILSPPEVILKAVELGLTGIAITDHDTVAGIKPALDYIQKTQCPLTIIPGIELNTDAGQTEVHILGYFLQWDNAHLLTRLIELKNAREERAIKMVRRLNEIGIEIRLQRVKELALGDLVGRPHVAQAIVEKGYCFSVKEAFDKYIGQGRPAYIPRYKFLPEEAINIVKEAGGITVLAHPGLINDDELSFKLLNMGIDGIEAYYPEHDENETRYYLNLAAERNLIVTGGSDFHGSIYDAKGKLGCIQVDDQIIENMRQVQGKRR